MLMEAELARLHVSFSRESDMSHAASHGTLNPGLPQMLVHLQVYGLEQLSCHAGHQEVSRCCTRGESEESIVCRQRNMQGRDPL